MRLESLGVIDEPLDTVYPLVRDRMREIVPYLPNIEKIEVVRSSRNDEGYLEVVNLWTAKAEVPSFVKSFVKPELFGWKDTAVWHDAEHQVHYRLESFVGKDLYDAAGVNFFKALPEGKTELRVTCDVVLHPERFPGVPRLLDRLFDTSRVGTQLIAVVAAAYLAG